MKKHILTSVILLISMTVYCQTSSFGLSLNAVKIEGDDGYSVNGNVRVQFNKMFGWQTEVSHFRSSETRTIIEEKSETQFGFTEKTTIITEERDVFYTVKTGVSIKFLEFDGFAAETIIGGGGFRSDSKIFGLLSGELFLSSQIGKNLVVGIPISYSFVTWERDDFTSIGISMRYHM